MHQLSSKISRYCVEHEIIDQCDMSWFTYGIEKRISTITVAIPFILIAFLISDYRAALSFFCAYFFVKKHLGGFHAKTVWGCILLSLVSELIFLGIVCPALSPASILCIMGISLISVFCFAPYNHPDLHLADEEIVACKKSCRFRIVIAVAVTVLAYILKLQKVADGALVGIAMAVAMLYLGHINDWRNIHNENTRRFQEDR